MIRYDITEKELRARIDRQKPDWQTRAAAATALYRRAGKYGEPDDKNWDTQTHGVPPNPFWSQIKAVYMRLQKNKCAFCERELTTRPKDHDVEHFRPKRAVVPWPPLPTDPAFPEGYYLLAYHPLNYATACEHCNRSLKQSYFPIEDARLSGQGDPVQLRPELPLLIYPIGDSDTDPEDLLGFQGVVPIPKNADPNTREYRRAQVTIDFFELEKRDELRRGRAKVLRTLYLAFMITETSPQREEREGAQSAIAQCVSDGSEHANCARSFVDLYRQNPAEAKQFGRLAIASLHKSSPA